MLSTKINAFSQSVLGDTIEISKMFRFFSHVQRPLNAYSQ